MEIAARPACLALMLALGACSSGEERTSIRPTSFDGEVLRIAVTRADGGT